MCPSTVTEPLKPLVLIAETGSNFVTFLRQYIFNSTKVLLQLQKRYYLLNSSSETYKLYYFLKEPTN